MRWLALSVMALVLFIGSCQPKNGKDGTSCTVHRDANGVSISCSDGTYAKVMDGEDGADGINGLNGQNGTPGSTIQKIKLCPDLTGGTFQEYVLKIDGDLFGVYASGNKIGLTALFPGNWVTTDGRDCHFTVTSNNDIVY